ncbi:efflux RND transporter periplasmic adaptor subunit [Maricaulis sp.]|jgi:membrane fusion protein, copper/silver efflux system|uniref:Cu(I)/Ag(I) efflux system membrane fusion protein n=2 Tax=Maricaulis maris TaxID=74318 RepID=A0A495D2D9_9PROT|nr:efflux RND transporter periplasmic adaptor subunit [Maricaulis sp.]MDF1769120.1 efflux RND transporter periplasmic adaptor subunit [Maricaulis sp.]RKQ95936.1 Cu(I)/Ag(I) efflux system membrane fusion protein [Maricaulis maris]
MTPRTILLGTGTLLAGIALGALGMSLVGGSDIAATSDEREILYWVAPMDPNFRQDEPGRSPMGMDLIPVYAGSEPTDDSTITISSAVENNIGVRTANVTRGRFAEDLATVGYVRPIDDLASVVDVRAQGWIEDLRIAAVGDVVEAGDLLFRMYSPEIVTAQSEFLQAVNVSRPGLVAAAGSRLRALGVNQAQIDSIAQRGTPQRLVDVYAPRTGVVLEMNVREGAHAHPSMVVMTIADLREVWVVADLFEDEAAAIEPGQSVRLQSRAQPGRMWHGQVEYLYPTVDPRSRSIPVRMRFANSDGALRPEAYVNVRIEASPRDNVLSVPFEAVIRTGQSERVVLALGDGRYRLAQVRTGAEADGRVEVLTGLSEGERVVVSSQFLIDSEASLQGVALRMAGADAPAAPPEIVQGAGVVDGVMASHGMIDLTHDPIPELGWPVMSMSFFTLDAVSLDGLSEGDEVSFTLRQNDEGQWRLASIARSDAAQPDPVVEGQGRVVTLMSDINMVEIDHERIEAIDMPAMSMVYELGDGVTLDGVSEGDHVSFSIDETRPGQWQISGIAVVRPVDAGGEE